jgi:ADP-ribose pyrophosphatase YjhB (NUDIX family)
VLEFPGGGVQPGESCEHAVRRECVEEVGVLPLHLADVGSFLVDNRRSRRRIHVFAGSACSQLQASPEAGEQISAGLVSVEEFERARACGLVENASCLAGWCLARGAVMDLLEPGTG